MKTLTLLLSLCLALPALAADKWALPRPVSIIGEWQTVLEVTVKPKPAGTLRAMVRVRAQDAAFKLLLNGKSVPITPVQEDEGPRVYTVYTMPQAVAAKKDTKIEVQAAGLGVVDSLELRVTEN